MNPTQLVADLEHLAGMVKNMRSAQREYFRTRTTEALRVARDWERRVDEACAAILRPPQPSLFE